MKKSKVLNIALWVIQVLLAASFIWAAFMKLFSPVEQIAQMWPWTAEYPLLLKVTGALDMLAGIGILLPMLLKLYPRLTAIAAWGMVALMVAAAAFHVSRGEANVIGVNVVFAVLAAVVGWGRWRVQ